MPTFREKKNFGDAFGYLRECLERQNIFVLLLGNLGSYHSNISSQAFRGYAISDSIAPFIVINDNDTRAAWSFTAFHEAAHLWLGQTGISGSSHERIIERFCNDVAGRLLLPISDLEELPSFGLSAFDDVLANISEFASARKISRRMVAYQLLRANLINSTLYKRLGDRFYSDWQRSKERSPNKTKDGRGPHPYVLLRHRLGPAIVGLAKRSLDGGQLSPTKASHLLGVKPVSVHSFLHPQPGVRADR